MIDNGKVSREFSLLRTYIDIVPSRRGSPICYLAHRFRCHLGLSVPLFCREKDRELSWFSVCGSDGGNVPFNDACLVNRKR